MAHKAAAGGSELSSGAEKKKMLLRKLLREPTLVTSHCAVTNPKKAKVCSKPLYYQPSPFD